MRYWFDENDEERRRRSAFDEGMAFLVPIETNLQEAVQHFHLLESDGIQQSWEQVDFERDILEDVYGVSQSPPDIVGTHALYTFCGIDCRDYDGPQMWILMPIRLWEHDQTLFHSVNCGGCRGTYLFELRRRGEKEKADFVEMIWLEQYGETNANCGGVHTVTPAHYVLTCRVCGRLAVDLENAGETTYL